MASSSPVTVPECLSAKFRDTFAYTTIKDRLPVILARVADTVYRHKNKIGKENHEDIANDLKHLAGCASKLRHFVQSDKPVEVLKDQRSDVALWNKCLADLIVENNGKPIKWFSGPWLYVECYMYRSIQQAIELTNNLKTMDVFEEQKHMAYRGAVDHQKTLMQHLKEQIDNLVKLSSAQKIALLRQYLEISLWSNQCDLSISGGQDNLLKTCILKKVEEVAECIILNDTDKIIESLQKSSKQPGGTNRVDIIIDNAGFELVTDLCLAEILMSLGFADSIHFHGKAMPWFVSDVTNRDFHWMLETMTGSKNQTTAMFGDKWQKRLAAGSWIFSNDDFWTTPYDYSNMEKYAAHLYADLGKSSLLIFKGDLNYRKLVGDRSWQPTTPFSNALCGFEPASLCVLRTMKSDVVTGMKLGQAEKMTALDERWMIDAKWAVMSFHEHIKNP